MKKLEKILILGAGCAATSTASALLDGGYEGEMTLVDTRTSFDREQRWCFWNDGEFALDHLVSHRWSQWEVSDGQQVARSRSDLFRYEHVYAPAFFASQHAMLRQAGVHFQLGVGTGRWQKEGDSISVESSAGSLRADFLIDARGLQSPAAGRLEGGFRQSFVGWVVETTAPAFDPGVMSLMDFQPGTELGFLYLLPFSPTSALVEMTDFSSADVAESDLEVALERYFQERGIGYEIRSRESGVLPMSSARLPIRLADRVWSAGNAGGCLRASSGYAFGRIQRQARQMARAILEEQPLPTAVAPQKYQWFDAVFLHLMQTHPRAARQAFIDLFAAPQADPLLRFLSDRSSLADDARVVGSLEKLPFLAAAIGCLYRALPHHVVTLSKSIRHAMAGSGSLSLPCPIRGAAR